MMTIPTRHPLTWPADWKRTASCQRNHGSKQALTTADGVLRVLRELEAMGISENDVIVSTNVQTRLEDLPRSGAAAPADPGAAVTAAPAGDRLIVLTDEQSADRVPAPSGRGYMVNVASNRNGVGYGAWHHIDGWSEAVIDYIEEIERVTSAQAG